MRNCSFIETETRLALKEAAGWFAAGVSFRRALTVLSDGAFKLFALLCLEADRRSGRYQTSQKELAVALGKSRRILGSYLRELQQKGVCRIQPGRNQFSRTVFEICDSFWPYHRATCPEAAKQNDYVSMVREAFLALECGKGAFTAADERTAGELERRGIPIEVVQDAILLGADRKHISLLNGTSREPIGSLQYFEALIAEIQHQPFPEGYREYLRMRNKRLAATWRKTAESEKEPWEGAYRDKGPAEIAQ